MQPRADGVVAVYQSAQVCLWVEDPESKAYLDALWSDGRIRTLVGGGAGAIAGLANAAWQDGLRHVFALRDRDFGTAKMPPGAKGPVFVVPRHELENYLLDENALAACGYNTRGAKARDIATEVERVARTLVAWMASRHVKIDLWSDLVAGFPADPKPDEIPDEAAASAWLAGKVASVGTTPAAGLIIGQLGTRIAEYEAHLHDGTWREQFSGKEIFDPVVRWVWNKSHTNPGGTKARVMVAGAIGERQRIHATIPQELDDLRSALLDHVGLR